MDCDYAPPLAKWTAWFYQTGKGISRSVGLDEEESKIMISLLKSGLGMQIIYIQLPAQGAFSPCPRKDPASAGPGLCPAALDGVLSASKSV